MTQNSRLQYGSVSKRGKKDKVWIGRWREEVAGSDNSLRTVRRSVILGTVEEIPTKRDAERELWERLQALNVGKQGASGSMTLRRFAEEMWKRVCSMTITSTRTSFLRLEMLHYVCLPGTEFSNGSTQSIATDCPGTRFVIFGPSSEQSST
jgi:hypothetical protein